MNARLQSLQDDTTDSNFNASWDEMTPYLACQAEAVRIQLSSMDIDGVDLR